MKTPFKILTTLAVMLIATFAMASQLDWNVIQSISHGLSNLPQDAINHISFAVGVVTPSGVITQQNVVGDPTETGAASDTSHEYLLSSDVEKIIQLYKPYQTPILTYISQMGASTSESYKKDYYAIDARGMTTTIVAVHTTLSAHVITLEVADSTIFTKDNHVYFTEITTATTLVGSGRFLVGHITAIPLANHITVKLLNYGTSNADGDFTNGMNIYRSATAANESSASATPWGGYPEMDYNYIQFFQEQIQMSELYMINKKAAEWNYGDVKRMAIEDFKLQKERAFLGGYRCEYTTTSGSVVSRHYSCGGFLNDPLIPYMGSITLSSLGSDTVTNIMKTIFAGNNGSKNKILLGGADFIEALENVKSDNKYMKTTESSVLLGVDIVKAVSTFGALETMYYEQLDNIGKPKTAIVIDKAFTKPCILKGKAFSVRDLDLKSAGLSSDSASVLEEWVTMLIMNKNAHHILQGV